MASPVFVPSAMALVEHSETQDVPKQLASPAPVIFLEAENFTDKSTQGRVVNFSHAWNQKVLAGWGNVPGDVVTYRLDLPASLASPVLFLKYAMETDRPAVLDVYVDGASKKVASLECPPTPGWGGIASDWKYVSLKLGRLAQGPHELRFVSAVGGPIHPDALVLAGDTGSRSTGTARITDSKPNFVEIETQVPSQGFLALSDVYYSGWKASVDGRPAKILRTNAVFRGLPLGPGNHTIQFRFEPRSVYAGAVVTLATLALCSFGLFRASRPKS